MGTKAICKGIIIQYGARYKMIVPHMPTYISFDDSEVFDGGFIPVRKLIPLEADPEESGDSEVAVSTYPVKLEQIRNIIEEGVE